MTHTKALAEFTARCIIDRCEKGHMSIDMGLEALAKDYRSISSQLAERDAQLAVKTTALKSIHWHVAHGTVNHEVFVQIVDDALATRQPNKESEAV